MARLLSLPVLVLLSAFLAACGSKAEADLEKSPQELRQQAKSMDKAQIQEAIDDLETLAKDLRQKMEGMSPRDAMDGKAKELGERAMKIAGAIMVYQVELQSRP